MGPSAWVARSKVRGLPPSYDYALGGWVQSPGTPFYFALWLVAWVGGSKVQDPPFILHCGLGGWVKSPGTPLYFALWLGWVGQKSRNPPSFCVVAWVGGSKVQEPPFILHCGLGGWVKSLGTPLPFVLWLGWVVQKSRNPPFILHSGMGGWVKSPGTPPFILHCGLGGWVKSPGPPLHFALWLGWVGQKSRNPPSFCVVAWVGGSKV